MKDLARKTVLTHAKFVSVKEEWDKIRKSLTEELKYYANKKSVEFCHKHGLVDQELFIVNLDGGSLGAGWKLSGGFFSRFPQWENGHYYSYSPTDKGTWIKSYFGDYRIGEETRNGPFEIKDLQELCDEMTHESGAEFSIYAPEAEQIRSLAGFMVFTTLEGEVIDHTETLSERDHDEY